MDYRELYNEWLTNPYFDDNTKKELEAIENDDKEIEDRFTRNLNLVQQVFVELLVPELTE